MKNILILGGTRGFGLELAREFLALGARVAITGRKLADAAEAARRLAPVGAGPGDKGAPPRDSGVAPRDSAAVPASKAFAFEADLRSFESLVRLRADAMAALGSIDILVVNGGINQAPAKAWEAAESDIDAVLATDLRGPMYAARAFMPGMVSAGKGSIWFIEGLGSNNMMVDKFSLYGTSKRGLAYYWRALAKEAAGTGLKVCALSPGMMVTDFLLANLGDREEKERAKNIRLYNILADKAETVARFAAPKIIANERNGRLLQWLTTPKVMARFLSAPFSKRNIVPRE
ncbi:MAG: SDR family oxidoreductase [Spirochaetales bacterium]|jgi:NAD(P)-dependent dehydrogenase (short-subunit alcohol dehydrogenase family)